MPVTINGTTGIAGVDGSAGTPAVQGGDTNTGIFFPAADTIAFAEGGAEVARFDSAGNMGIGVTPSAWSGAWKAIQVGSVAAFTASGTTATYGCNWYDDGTAAKYVTNGFAARYTTNNAGQHQWFTAASGTAGNAISFTQAMTLDSSGNLLVGTTSNTSTLGVAVRNGFDANSTIAIGKNNGAGSNNYIEFFFGGASRGYIAYNGSGGINYFSASDYRLKENIAPMTGALAKVAALKPVTYDWKETGKASEGFIAHELQEVFPDAVSYAKDAVDAEGKPVYQGIDTSFLVATLTAAIQEQQALIESLTARIAALEAA